MPNFETKDQLVEYYDNAMKKFADENEKYTKAKAIIYDIFTSGISYVDKKGEPQKTPDRDPEKPKDEVANAKINEDIFNKGEKLILESSRPGGCASLMMWYAKTKGISAEDIIELGKNPKSENSIKIQQRLEGMKQDYVDLINSGDTDKISDFFVEAFKTFKKEASDLMLNSGNVDSFIKNWPYITQWNGATSILQQSMGNSADKITPAQYELISKINEGIKKDIGKNLELKDMIGLMQPIQKINVAFANELPNNKAYEYFLKQSSEYKWNDRQKFADAVRTFSVSQNIAKKNAMTGKPLVFVTKEMGKAMSMVSFGIGYGGADPGMDDFDENYMVPESDMYISQMKYLAGDTAYTPIYNLLNASNQEYADPDDPISNAYTIEALVEFCNRDEYNEILNSKDSISTIVERKINAKEPLTYAEIGCYLSDKNPKYTEDMKQATREFFAMNPVFRMNKLPKTLKHVLTSYCENMLGVSPEEYIAGAKTVSNACKQQYKSQIKDIENHKATDVVNFGFGRKMMDIFRPLMKDVSSTIASSKEFVEMENAFKNLMSKDPDYPKGREEEYRIKLAALKDKAGKYIQAKKADGKKERLTGRGQKRFNIAQRLEAFAGESLAQIELAKEAHTLAYVPEEIKTSYNAPDFNRRVDEMLAPHAKGSQELIDNEIYVNKKTDNPKDNYYVPDDITLPENCPFSDHDFAIISYSELANIEHFTEGMRYDERLDGNMNTLLTFPFSHDDIFIKFREKTQNDVPLFNKARHGAEELVKKYMNGNPKPLAKSLKNNIDVTLTHLRTLSTTNRNMQDHVISARQTLDLLTSDPKLFKESGITREEIKELVAKEAQMKLFDEKDNAIKELNDGTQKTPEQRDALYAKIIVSDIINAAEDNEVAKLQSSPQMDEMFSHYNEIRHSISSKKLILNGGENGDVILNDKAREQTEKEIQELEKQAYIAYSKIEHISFFKPVSSLLNRFTDSKTFDLNVKALTTIIRKSPQFEEMKGSYNGVQIKATKAVAEVMKIASEKMGLAVDNHILKQGKAAELAFSSPEKQIKNPEIENPQLQQPSKDLINSI